MYWMMNLPPQDCPLRLKSMPVTLEIRSGSERLPCLLGGVSPFLFLAQSRITGSLFTWRDNPYYRYCGLTSVKSMSVNRGIPRRSERPSPEVSTKEAMMHFAFMAMTLLLLRFNFPFCFIKTRSLENNNFRFMYEGVRNE